MLNENQNQTETDGFRRRYMFFGQNQDQGQDGGVFSDSRGDASRRSTQVTSEHRHVHLVFRTIVGEGGGGKCVLCYALYRVSITEVTSSFINALQ